MKLQLEGIIPDSFVVLREGNSTSAIESLRKNDVDTIGNRVIDGKVLFTELIKNIGF